MFDVEEERSKNQYFNKQAMGTSQKTVLSKPIACMFVEEKTYCSAVCDVCKPLKIIDRTAQECQGATEAYVRLGCVLVVIVYGTRLAEVSYVFPRSTTNNLALVRFWIFVCSIVADVWVQVMYESAVAFVVC